MVRWLDLQWNITTLEPLPLKTNIIQGIHSKSLPLHHRVHTIKHGQWLYLGKVDPEDNQYEQRNWYLDL